MGPRELVLEASIAELSPGGEGVAICESDSERRAVFVPGVARGERVRVEVDWGKRPARAKLLAVLDPSPFRVAPPCAHVDRCGGCDWMHLAPAEQIAEHERIVRQLLRLDESFVGWKSHAAPRTLGYRTRARVHLEAKRGRVVVGMFGRRSHEPAAVDTCAVLDPVLDRTRGSLSTLLEGAEGRGEAQLSLGAPRDGDGERLAVVDLRWMGELPAAVFGRLERALGTSDEPPVLAGARVFAGDVRIPAKIGDPSPFIVAADGAPLRLAPGGFSQATEEGNVVLARRVAELARTLAPGPCVELHAGAGNHTVLLARDREVVAVERDADACAAARANLAARGLSARVVEADAGTFTIPKATKLVVLDPPREGARAVAETLAARGARRPDVLYVSCDPPTLARDIRTLEGAGYVVRAVETFEMFPHTSHVETVVVLTP
jgi:23S rRNA (uracil1939-C5)-methyltransferase